MAEQGMGNKKIATTLGLVAEAALGRRDGAAQRWATTRRGGWFVSPVPCLYCSRAVLYSRQCSPTSAGIRHQARQQQRPEVHEGRALASEASDTWETCHYYFVAFPQVKNQHLTALTKRRRLEWRTSMLQRLGLANRPHLGTLHTHFQT